MRYLRGACGQTLRPCRGAGNRFALCLGRISQFCHKRENSARDSKVLVPVSVAKVGKIVFHHTVVHQRTALLQIGIADENVAIT